MLCNYILACWTFSNEKNRKRQFFDFFNFLYSILGDSTGLNADRIFQTEQRETKTQLSFLHTVRITLEKKINSWKEKLNLKNLKLLQMVLKGND